MFTLCSSRLFALRRAHRRRHQTPRRFFADTTAATVRAAGRASIILAVVIAGLAALPCTNLLLAAPKHAIVPSFERFHAQPDANAGQGGALLLGELNCVSCHQVTGTAAAWVARKQAPVLDHVGSRVRPEYIRDLLLDPQAVKPGTTMPAVLTGANEAERREQAEALAHFLSLMGTLPEASAVKQAVQRGEQLFHRVGCVACHDPQTPDAPTLPDSMPLGQLSRKYSLPSLAQFLADPLTTRPAGRMPHLNLNAEESRDIASFLMRDVQIPPNVSYRYYEGTWDNLPDFNALKPKSTGTTSGLSVGVGRNDNFGIRFEAFLQVAADGDYRFHLGSDDGSRLLIDDVEIAKVDGVHPLTWGAGTAKLKAGPHKIVVEFFEVGGGEELRVEWEGGKLARQSVEFALTLTAERPKTADNQPAWAPDPQKAAKGKTLFGQLGCASCHKLGDSMPASNELVQPKELGQLREGRGCLAESPGAGAPRYTLSASQKSALVAGLTLVRSAPAAPAGEAALSHAMTRFNCYACHQRGEIGGVVEGRNKYFQSNQPEMGDEGRIPPPLTGVGAKLRPEWFQHVFGNGAKDRPYMFTRMPKFGTNNLVGVAEAFAAADPEPPYERVAAGVSDGVLKATGRRLVGGQGYSCIKCHTWGNIPATGIQSIGMTTMTRRLREPWFHAYILDPPKYRPGTRMPAAWPMGQSLLPNVLGGDTSKQIHSVWAFLSDGDRAAIPLGLGRDPIELVAVDRAVIYRNFIEGAGPRAIGVGYPEKINVAFDANDLRLALAWQGAFIDAARHWTDRGVGFQGPLGDNVLKLTGGVEWAKLDAPEATWPTQSAKQLGYHFRGYRLASQGKPVYQYDAAGVRIEDEIQPAAATEQARLTRTLTVSLRGDEPAPPASKDNVTNSGAPAVAPTAKPGDTIWFRAAAGQKIEAVGAGEWRVDGLWNVKLTVADATPVVRSSGNRAELLVPVKVARPSVRIVQEIVW